MQYQNPDWILVIGFLRGPVIGFLRKDTGELSTETWDVFKTQSKKYKFV